MRAKSTRSEVEGGARHGRSRKLARKAAVLGGVIVAVGAQSLVVAAAFVYAVTTALGVNRGASAPPVD